MNTEFFLIIFIFLYSSGMSEYFWVLERCWNFYCIEDVLCWLWFSSHSHVTIVMPDLLFVTCQDDGPAKINSR